MKQKARSTSDISYLASPVTGGGVIVNRFAQLFLLARTQNHKQPQDWAQYVWNLLQAQGHKLIKEGTTIESAEDNLAELTRQTEEFAAKQLPVLKALRIA